MSEIVRDLTLSIAEYGARCIRRRKITPLFDRNWQCFRSAQLREKQRLV